MNAKITIASTLKPVIDPRVYEKIGKSLVATGKYDVHIIGSYPTTKAKIANIKLHPIASFSRNMIARTILSWRIYHIIKRLKPDILIISTHELLVIGVLYKIISGCKLIYDIRENYYFNLLYQNNYPWGFRHLLGFYVRLKETITTKFTNHFLLAEKCYEDELPYINNKYTIIENKYLPLNFNNFKQNQDKVELLLSGTISKEYGALEAIDFFDQINNGQFRLVIIGHCPNHQTFRDLKQRVSSIENIDLKISKAPIPYRDILSHVGNKTIGLLPYKANKSTQNKIPTKLYEYIGMKIPILISYNRIWDKLIEKYHAGLSIDFNKKVNIDDLGVLISLSKQFQSSDLKELMWKTEELKLLKMIESL